MTLRFRLAALALAVAFLGAFVVAPLSTEAKPQRGGFSQEVSGTLDGAPFAGTLTITEFTNDGGVLTAVGVITDADGTFVSGFTAPVESLSVQSAEAAGGVRAYIPQGQGASCQILFLTLGPLELDLLGLVIEIPQPIILNIRAEPGPGNLLGNLLCAIAGLLDPGPIGGGGLGGALNQIINLLNQILGAL